MKKDPKKTEDRPNKQLEPNTPFNTDQHARRQLLFPMEKEVAPAFQERGGIGGGLAPRTSPQRGYKRPGPET